MFSADKFLHRLMDLKHLREFMAIVETGSYSRASERLSVSQSVLSKHMVSLETELGVQLLNRSQKAATLTEFGDILYPYAKKILIEHDHYFETFNQMKNSQRKSIIIGCIESMKLYGLMQAIEEFKVTYPDIEVTIQNGEADLKDHLLREQVDIAFVREPPKLFSEDERIGAVKCVSDTVVAILPSDHPLAQKGSVSLIQLKDEPFYFLERELPLSRLCINTCNSAGFSPKISGSGFSGPEIVDLISRVGGVALLARKPFEENFRDDPRVKAVEISQYFRTYITLIYLSDSSNPLVSTLFLPFFLSHLPPKNT